MASALASPGESMQAALKKPLTSGASHAAYEQSRLPFFTFWKRPCA